MVGEPVAGVDEYGEWVSSAIGFNANENVDVEELGGVRRGRHGRCWGQDIKWELPVENRLLPCVWVIGCQRESISTCKWRWNMRSRRG
jgi:hypothetical protein